MFIALDCNGQRVSIENATKGNQYFCEECNAPVIVRAKDSLCIRPHFAHKHKSDCWYDYENCMSDWHREWQHKFPEKCREVVVTNKETGIKHRADIFINNTVIEFQHSPITAEEIAKRNNFYLSCGYNVVWVFDATNKIMNCVGNSIDPMQCRENDLCWKMAKRQFATPMPPQVKIFLQYKAVISRFPNQETDIMIQLSNNAPKSFTFLKTGLYILQNNFLQEYGALSDSKELPINSINLMTQLFLTYIGPLPNNRELSSNEINMIIQRLEDELNEQENRNKQLQSGVYNIRNLPIKFVPHIPTTRYLNTNRPLDYPPTTTCFTNRRKFTHRKRK